jgi:hypothetical protein
MNAITIESLGFTKEELQNRVIQAIVEQVMRESFCDADGEEIFSQSRFGRALNEAVKKRTDEAITEIAEKHILPNAATYIENVTFQKTNQWGEKTAEPETFREYLARKAENYLTEEVNYEGKSKEQAGGYSWTKAQTRIAHMVNQHLHYSIESIMKKAVANANNAIAEGIEEAVKIKLKEITSAIQVSVKTK